MKTSTTKNRLIKISAIAFWILVWHIASLLINQEILLVSPFSVFKNFSGLIFQKDFYLVVLNSVLSMISGFCAALVFGVFLSYLAFKYILVAEILKPIMSVVKTAPVVSFIIICLMYLERKSLAGFTAFLMITPIVYSNILTGLNSVDKKIVALSDVFEVRGLKKFLYVYVSSVFPFFYSAAGISAGLCWKSGIAAEVIGIVRGTIGEKLYNSKIYLDTVNLLTWTFVIIIISFCFERLLLLLLDFLMEKLSFVYTKEKFTESEIFKPNNEDIEIIDLEKSFGDKKIFDNLNLTIKNGETLCLMAPSGFGKTTLLNILTGIDKNYKGQIKGLNNKKISAVFQEYRLFENLSVLTNLNFPLKNTKSLDFFEAEAEKLGLCGILTEKAKNLSGGMKSRVALLRSLIYESDVVFMDEPFKGLDETTKEQVIKYVKEKTVGKTLVVVSHDLSECQKLNGRIVDLEL